MEKFKQACLEIDKIHSNDPQKVIVENEEIPAELLYSNRMVDMLEWFFPDPSEALKLAARCQHFKRWEIHRNKYPMDKKGYHAWRNELFDYQANEAEKVLKQAGYDPDIIGKVSGMIRKVSLKSSDQARTIEDVACLVFFKHYALEFSTKHDLEKVKHIVLRTLSKMTNEAKSRLLELDLEPEVRDLV